MSIDDLKNRFLLIYGRMYEAIKAKKERGKVYNSELWSVTPLKWSKLFVVCYNIVTGKDI